jgi:hypothetical protein
VKVRFPSSSNQGNDLNWKQLRVSHQELDGWDRIRMFVRMGSAIFDREIRWLQGVNRLKAEQDKKLRH